MNCEQSEADALNSLDSALAVFADTDQYHTPKDARVSPVYRIPLLRSPWFHLRFCLGLLRRSRRLAIRGGFDDQALRDAGFHYLRMMEQAGAKFHVAGLSRLDQVAGPVVVVANHMSLCETFVLPAMINPRKHAVSFVVKQSLVDYPIFGPVMRATRPVAVTRKNPREDFRRVMQQGSELLGQGRSVIIFPETRRRLVFRAEHFNTLGERLAERAKVPVVPVALRTDFLAHGRLILDFGPLRQERAVHFEFGEPLLPGGGLREKHQAIVDFIGGRLRQWGVACEE